MRQVIGVNLRTRLLLWPVAVLFLHQALSGFLLSLHFSVTGDNALGSLRYLESHGLGILRASHKLGSVAFYFYTFFLLVEITVKRIHAQSRTVYITFLWVFVLAFFAVASGQVLPGTAEAYAALAVSKNVMLAAEFIPFADHLHSMLFPGVSVLSAIPRFFTVHTTVFPMLLLGLIIRLYYHREIYEVTENSFLLRLQRYARYLTLPAILSLLAWLIPSPVEMPADFRDRTGSMNARLEMLWLFETMNFLSSSLWPLVLFVFPVLLLHILPWLKLFSLSEKLAKLFLVLFLLMILILTAFGYIRRENARPSPKLIAQGKELFDSGECSDCHRYRPGTWEKKLPQSYLNDLKVADGDDFIDITYAHRSFDKNELKEYIVNAPAWAQKNKLVTKMPSFEGQFSEAELNALAEFIMNIRALPGN